MARNLARRVSQTGWSGRRVRSRQRKRRPQPCEAFRIAPAVLRGNELFVVRPHPDNLDGPLLFPDLIDQPVLDVDPSREESSEVAGEFFVRWRRQEGVAL